MDKYPLKVLVLILVFVSIPNLYGISEDKEPAKRPNIVILMADDLEDVHPGIFENLKKGLIKIHLDVREDSPEY